MRACKAIAIDYSRSGLGFFVWQREEKGRAFARLAFDQYLDAVALDDVLDDGRANE